MKHEIFLGRQEMAFVRLEAIARADNPYSLVAVFWQGYFITKSRGVAYAIQYNPVEVVPRVNANCTEEIPVNLNSTSLFVDPISYAIKSAALPTQCNDIAPPRWNIAGRSYCTYPAIWECASPGDLTVEVVQINDKDCWTWDRGSPSTARFRWRSS
jgi:hypothetical protein